MLVILQLEPVVVLRAISHVEMSQDKRSRYLLLLLTGATEPL